MPVKEKKSMKGVWELKPSFGLKTQLNTPSDFSLLFLPLSNLCGFEDTKKNHIQHLPLRISQTFRIM